MGAPAEGGGGKKSVSEGEVFELAKTLGVSPRRLHGWEPATVTTYEYEGDKLVRSVTVREPEFTPPDLVILRGWMREELAPRGAHGHLLSEAMSPDADPGSWDATRRYRVPPPSRDFAAKAISDAQEAYKKRFPDADLSSLRWRVESEPI